MNRENAYTYKNVQLDKPITGIGLYQNVLECKKNNNNKNKNSLLPSVFHPAVARHKIGLYVSNILYIL